MLVVGKIVGEIGLAAISNASMLCFIINSLCIGLTMGGSVLVLSLIHIFRHACNNCRICP